MLVNTKSAGAEAEVIPFDILIVASGSTNSLGDLNRSFASSEERGEAWKTLRLEITKAKRIAIVGGGVVGIEAAGEILDFMHDDFTSKDGKTLHVIHSGSQLVGPMFSAKLANLLLQKVKARGVTDVIFNSKVKNLKDEPYTVGPVSLDLGDKSMEFDLVLNAVGNKINVFSGLERTSKGFVVDDIFRAKNYSNIFCIGDCADAGDVVKTFMNLKNHVAVTLKAIEVWVAGGGEIKPERVGKRYTPAAGEPKTLIPLGRVDGASNLGLPLCLIKWIKGKDLFTDMQRKELA